VAGSGIPNATKKYEPELLAPFPVDGAEPEVRAGLYEAVLAAAAAVVVVVDDSERFSA
jgi:hypothetical protein